MNKLGIKTNKSAGKTGKSHVETMMNINACPLPEPDTDNRS